MINDAHSSYRELIPAYALEALESEEIGRLGKHLETCQECNELLAEFSQVVEGLLNVAPPRTPPPYLRAKLREEVTNKRQSKAVPASRAQKFGSFAYGLVTVLLLVTTILLAVQVRDLRNQRSNLLQRLQENQIALEIAAQPGAELLTLFGDQGRGNLVMVPGASRGALILYDLPLVDPGFTYQVWLIPAEGQPESAGLLQFDPGQNMHLFEVASIQPLEDFAGLGITVEPSGGSILPSSKPILSLSF